MLCFCHLVYKLASGLLVASVRSAASSLFSAQLSRQHAADVCAATTHRSQCGIHTVGCVGQRGAVTTTPQWRWQPSRPYTDTKGDYSVTAAGRAASYGWECVETNDIETFGCRWIDRCRWCCQPGTVAFWLGYSFCQCSDHCVLHSLPLFLWSNGESTIWLFCCHRQHLADTRALLISRMHTNFGDRVLSATGP